MIRRSSLFLLLTLLTANAFAQSATTATIRGKITNAQGQPVANAEVNAVNAASGFVRTVNSRPDGTYTLNGLTPGPYNIVVASTGYQPITQDVTVLVGQTLDLNVDMASPATLNESITVVGSQAVETRATEVATNVTTQQIENLPQDDRNFLNFAALAPGVRVSKDPMRKTFAGDAQDAEQTNVFIDGVSTKNDVLQGGTSGQDSSRGNPFPQSAVQEFRVITQNYSAQYDHASSAIITAVTKSGGNDFRGQAFVFYQPNAWVAPTAKGYGFSTLATNKSYKRTQPGLSIGGPIVKDKVHFFGTWEADDERADKLVTITNSQFGRPFLGSQGSFSAPFKSNLAFAKFSLQGSPNQVVDLSGSYRKEHETRDFGNETSFVHANDLNNHVYTGTLRDQWTGGSTLNEALLSFQRYGWATDPLNPTTPGQRYFAPGFATVFLTGGNPTTQQFDQRRVELRDNFNFAPWNMAGLHQFQAGGNVDFMHYRVNKSQTGNPEFKYLPDENGNYGNIPFEADFGAGNPILSTSNNEYGIYGQDNWAVNNKFTLNLGLRWDYESKMLDTDYVTPANITAALKGKTFLIDGRNVSIPDEFFSTGSERKPFTGEIQPRFGFSYDLFGNSRSVLFGGAGRYYDRLFLNSTLDERFRLQFPVYRVEFSPNGAPGTIKWDPSYFSAAGMQQLVNQGAAHPEIYLMSNNTKPPYSTQYNLGFRQTLGSWLGSLNYNAVRGKRGITFVSASGTCCAALAPGFGNVIINDPVGKSFWYDGESITLERPFTSQTNWGARFVYTHAKAEQNGNDLFSLDLPSAADYARHPVAGSEPNYFNASGIVGLPWELRFSTNVTLSTGPATVYSDFSQGFSLAGRLATGVKHAVYPPKSGGFGYRNVDFRLTKDFGLGTRTVGVIAEVFNAFNFTNYGCLTDFRGEGQPVSVVGNPTCVVSLGRREQLGLRFNF